MGVERRQETRHGIQPPSGLRLTPRSGDLQGRELVAKLVDASEGGLGVETFANFEPGVAVDVSADMVSSDLALRVTGEARVAYSRECAPGRFRVGLELLEIHLSHIPGALVADGRIVASDERSATEPALERVL